MLKGEGTETQLDVMLEVSPRIFTEIVPAEYEGATIREPQHTVLRPLGTGLAMVDLTDLHREMVEIALNGDATKVAVADALSRTKLDVQEDGGELYICLGWK